MNMTMTRDRLQDYLDDVERNLPDAPLPAAERPFEGQQMAMKEYARMRTEGCLERILPPASEVVLWSYRAEEGDSWQARILPWLVVFPNWGPHGGLAWEVDYHDEVVAHGRFSDPILRDSDEVWDAFSTSVALAMRKIHRAKELEALIANQVSAEPDLGYFGLLPIERIPIGARSSLFVTFVDADSVILTAADTDDAVSIRLHLTPNIVSQLSSACHVPNVGPTDTGSAVVDIRWREKNSIVELVIATEDTSFYANDAAISESRPEWGRSTGEEQNLAQRLGSLLIAWQRWRLVWCIWNAQKEELQEEYDNLWGRF